MQPQMDLQDQLNILRGLLDWTRVASLSTLKNGAPFGSMVPFMWDAKSGHLYVHLSRLAKHTRHIEADPRVALLVTEADSPGKNPLSLQRACFTGTMTRIERDTPDYEAAKHAYLAHFPTSEMVFQLPDFTFYVLAPEAIHLVAGFGKAFNVDPATLATG